ncbi:retron St85 family effector protein [Bacillus thuringiensis]|uniref:retron St85 family effector protein n=1 Tax=Bacillus thuringiensis TaxID=1428 RepID=UPI000A3A85F3|nr:retron St85 family effector protein [Bacillus thuringiensis]MED2123991.1 retron St85 family effector protein [Bacillus thuringiensis]MED2147034.1 retron St85 family effector protein [Bacillus thuringiensis]MED2174833.1 retron St85 family effector protein [Bacillus thuringiensis]MED2476454.1 retron St85 family effector protein [Bacillus thuringiensis]MED2576387.1 retron St85 family effector protein [Bacillus thuringiensis]
MVVQRELTNRTQKTLLKIHDDIYIKINEFYVDIFLCGGASSPKNISLRDKVRDSMKKKRNIRIMYPEDLFVELLNKNKEHDLLSLEKFLANNCDIICIICESGGSLVELGAFTNNEETFDKVVAVIEEKKKRERSFIMLGPIKMIEKKNKKHVIFYKKEKIDELNMELAKIFGQRNKNVRKNSSPSKPLNSMIGSYYFIPLLLFFYKNLTYKDLINFMKFLYKEKKHEIREFDTIFNSSLKLLFKDKTIVKNLVNNQHVYMLTHKGYKNMDNIIRNLNTSTKLFLCDQIRFGIMKEKYYM